MAKPSKGDSSASELHSDAWSRFERAVDVVAKSPPRPKKKEKAKEERRQRYEAENAND